MKLYRRENYLKKIRAFYHADDIIKVITGVRRCGKSSLMETIADEIREKETYFRRFKIYDKSTVRLLWKYMQVAHGRIYV